MTATFPNDDPVIPQLAYPTGQRVLIGPLDYGGREGVVDWSLDKPSPARRFCPPMRMTESYPRTVPIRTGYAVEFHNCRWIQAIASTVPSKPKNPKP